MFSGSKADDRSEGTESEARAVLNAERPKAALKKK
jgi:hypothetical protein